MQTKVQVNRVTQIRLFTGVSQQPGYLVDVKVVFVQWPRGRLLGAPPSTKCYICSGSRVGGLVRVRILGAVLTEGRATAQVCDPRLLVAAVGEVGFTRFVQVLGQEDQAAVWGFRLAGAAGDEAPGVVLRGVGQAEVITTSPRCGALIEGGGFLGNTPLLLLLQLSNFLLIM